MELDARFEETKVLVAWIRSINWTKQMDRALHRTECNNVSGHYSFVCRLCACSASHPLRKPARCSPFTK